MFKKSLAINIELNSIKFIEYKLKKKSKKILNIEKVFIPNDIDNRDEFIKIKIKEILKEKKWMSHIINVNRYSSDLYIRGIQIPVIPNDEILIVLKREIKKFYGEIGNQKLIYEIMGEIDKDDKKEYVIFYIILPDSYLKLLENLDIKINSLDFDVFALNRIFKLNQTEKGNTMYIDFGFENLKLFVYIDANLIIYREVNIGGDEITRTISNFLQISYDEAEELKKEYGYISKQKTEELLEYGEKRGMYLNIAYQSVMDKIVRKLIHSIDYFTNQNKGSGIDKIYLCGGSSKLKNIKDLLIEELQIDNVEIYTGTENFEYDKSLESYFFENSSCYTNLLGMTLIDKILYKPTKILKKVNNKSNKNYLKIIMIIIVLLLPIAYILNNEFKNYSKSNNEIKKIQKNIDMINDASNNYDEILSKYNKIIEDEQRYEILNNKKNDLIDFLFDISHIISDRMYFETLSYDNNIVLIKGVVISEDGFPMINISDFSKKLENEYNKVVIKNSKQEEFNYKASFNMELEIGGELNIGQ